MKDSMKLLLFFTILLSTQFRLNLAGAVKLTVTPTVLSRSGDSVTVNWTGIDNPYDMDWLGIYSPSDSSNDNFIGYLFLNSSSSWSSGSGSLSIPLLNLRSSYQFRVFIWNSSQINAKKHDHDQNPLPQTRHLLARSDQEVSFSNYNDPTQIHLALTGKDGEMRVMFLTKDKLKSFVKYGLEEGKLQGVVEAESTTYSRSDMCDSPANTDVGWRDAGIIHDAVMKDLKPGIRYYYQVGSNEGGWSSTYSFVSQDQSSNETYAFLFGDMGTHIPFLTFIRTQEESKQTIKWIQRDIQNLGTKPAMISHIGDISYARGYAWVWDSFFTQIEPIASQVPYHVCIGNHEYDWLSQPWKPSWSYGVYGNDGGGECGIPYSLKFNMPGNSSLATGNGGGATRNLHYSVDVGVVHFVYMSTETNFLPGSDQYEFLKHDLESVNREKTPFIVFQGHRPMYTTSNELRDAPLKEKMLEHLEPLLVANRVSIALWAHVHRYERFCPLRNYTCSSEDSGTNKSLPVHMVIGMGGQDWQSIWEPRPNHPDMPVFPQPARSMYRGGEFGYVRLNATREKMTLTYIGNHDGKAHDTVDVFAEATQAPAVKTGSGATVGSSTSQYVIVGSLVVAAALAGFLVGFLVKAKKDAVHKNNWTAIKVEEI